MVRYLSLAIASLVASSNVARNLSYEFIAGYGPDSSVTDHNAIDLDQKIIEAMVDRLTESSFDLAEKVYAEGGHSESYAKLTITNGVIASCGDKTLVSGIDNSGVEVVGKVYKSSSTPANEIWIQYQTTDVQASYVGCQVGALAATGDHNTSGCFQPKGSITGCGDTIEYSHDNLTDTKNGRTIRGFSTAVDAKMLTCANCPYDDAGYFNKYYGDAAYADKWIIAALDGTKTGFTSGRGDADFSLNSLVGRGEAVKKGTVYMAVFMYVIREFEDALDNCTNSCIGCNDDPVHAWDAGVAFYSGSLELQDGLSSGKLLHQLADNQCKNFNTCADDTRSNVNKQLLQLFNVGQGQLQAGLCDDARETTAKVVDLMYVPMIQGTQRSAYKVEKLSGGEKEKAEGAVFAAAVLPRIFAEDEAAAQTIYDSMKVGASATDHKKVKKAFESVYSALGIKCSDVGGLMDDGTSDYYKGAEPCSDAIGGDQCDFDNGGDDAVCVAEGSRCHSIGGNCVVGCVDTDSHVCLPGICSKKPESTKAPKEPKAGKGGKGSKAPTPSKGGKGSKAPTPSKGTKRDRFLKKDEDVDRCSCLVPKVCFRNVEVGGLISSQMSSVTAVTSKADKSAFTMASLAFDIVVGGATLLLLV